MNEYVMKYKRLHVRSGEEITRTANYYTSSTKEAKYWLLTTLNAWNQSAALRGSNLVWHYYAPADWLVEVN